MMDPVKLRVGPQFPLLLDSSLQFIGAESHSMKDRVLQAGRKNEKLSDVPDYAPTLLSHKDRLDEHLELKLLHVAAWTGDVPTIQYLKPFGDGTARTAGGFTPLHLAASRGHTEALRLLLEWPNVDVEARSSEGFTALHLAAYGGHLDCVQLLLKKCSTDDHVNAKDNVMERSALHWAVCHTSGGDSFDLLLQTPGIQTCPKDRVGFTPLHFASMNGEFTDLNGIVFELLSRHPDTVNDKVGNVRHFLTLPGVKQFDCKPWRELSGIKMVRPGKATQFPASLHDSGFMSGYTALHFAVCQNNVDVVSHLLRFPGIEVNEPGFVHGLTPLHCSLLYGAMEVFVLLMSFEKVDVNTQLVQGGDAESHWEKPRPEVYDALFRFRSLETPLHFAIRFCTPHDFLQMMIRFCNHPKVKVATCNDEGVLPLQLAWGRSYLAGIEDTDLDIDLDPDTQLQHALDILEGQPGNELLMSKLSDRAKAFENIMNAVLVSATLIASVTFSAIVQSPLRGDPTNDDSKVEKVIVRTFGATISVSFYTAVTTIVCCLVSLLVQPAQKSHRRRLHHDIRRDIQNFSVFMLLFSVYLGACAFVVSGYMNMPSYAILYMTLANSYFFLGGIILLPFQAVYGTGHVSVLDRGRAVFEAVARAVESVSDMGLLKALGYLRSRNKRKYSGVYAYGYSLRLVGDATPKTWCVGAILYTFYMSVFLVFLPVSIPFFQSFKEFFVFIFSQK